MAIKPNYSALSKLNGTYVYAPFGWQVVKEGDPVGYAVIQGQPYYLWELTPETQHLPKITVDGYAHHKPTLDLCNTNLVGLVFAGFPTPISEGTVVVSTFDRNRQEFLTTVFPVDETEAGVFIRWASERFTPLVAGSADYALG